MNQRTKDSQNPNEETQRKPNVLPATEVKNPNPRANENLKDKHQPETNKGAQTGTEITDGEDG